MANARSDGADFHIQPQGKSPDLHLAKNQNGKRREVVVAQERCGRTRCIARTPGGRHIGLLIISDKQNGVPFVPLDFR
jgi:hypothetical protein